MKRLFQVTLVGMNVVPLLTGILVATSGAAFFVPAEQVTAEFDAQIRVYGTWFTAIFFLSIWMR